MRFKTFELWPIMMGVLDGVVVGVAVVIAIAMAVEVPEAVAGIVLLVVLPVAGPPVALLASGLARDGYVPRSFSPFSCLNKFPKG